MNVYGYVVLTMIMLSLGSISASLRRLVALYFDEQRRNR